MVRGGGEGVDKRKNSEILVVEAVVKCSGRG